MIWAGAGALALAALGTKTHGYDPLAWQFSYTRDGLQCLGGICDGFLFSRA